MAARGAPRHRPPRRVLWLPAVALAAVMTSSAASIDRGSVLLDERVAALVAACSREMADSVCRVTNDTAGIAPATAVFVAGSGQIDATAYRRLREAGDGMCREVKRSCTADWAGPDCSTARRLWDGR